MKQMAMKCDLLLLLANQVCTLQRRSTQCTGQHFRLCTRRNYQTETQLLYFSFFGTLIRELEH